MKNLKLYGTLGILGLLTLTSVSANDNNVVTISPRAINSNISLTAHSASFTIETRPFLYDIEAHDTYNYKNATGKGYTINKNETSTNTVYYSRTLNAHNTDCISVSARLTYYLDGALEDTYTRYY